MEFYIDGLKKYFDFTGVASRQQYWMFFLFSILVFIPLVIVDSLLGVEFLGAIYNLAIVIPTVSIAARRFHDIGKSGWWQLILLIPLIGLLIFIYFMCQKSNPESEYLS